MQWCTYLTFSIFAVIGINGNLFDRIKDVFYEFGNVVAHVRHPIKDNDITYYYFEKSNPEKSIELGPIGLNNMDDIGSWNKEGKIVFLIHGWRSDTKNDWYENLKNAFFTRKDVSVVIEVDWKALAKSSYSVAVYYTNDIGKRIGDLILEIHTKHEIPLENFILLGHSLGAHVSGFTGKRVLEKTGQKLSRIIALDPPSLKFETAPENERLNSNDAEVVEVIHTDSTGFGAAQSIGTIDFWPNGGKYQPECFNNGIEEMISCSHGRSHLYFTYAVADPTTMLAKRCKDWRTFENDKCDDVTVALGDIDTMETGNFYLRTEDKHHNIEEFLRRFI